MKRYNRKKNSRWNTMKILVTGFLLVIVTGAVLLWLPVSNQKPIEFFDALFTSAEKRTLRRIELTDAVAADATFNVLMGEKVEPRKEFIERNAKYAVNLDY